jgi:hypothetical protein
MLNTFTSSFRSASRLQRPRLAVERVRCVVPGLELAPVQVHGDVLDVQHAEVHYGHVEDEDFDVQLQLSARLLAELVLRGTLPNETRRFGQFFS